MGCLAVIILVSQCYYVFINYYVFTGKKNGQRVANHLASVYPAMFKFDEKDAGGIPSSSGGYGLGGVKGLKNLSSTICSRVGNWFWHYVCSSFSFIVS